MSARRATAVTLALCELLASSAWLGVPTFIGALFVESYGPSVTATGLVLGAGALAYVPGNLVLRRWVETRGRTLLVGLALASGLVVLALGALRPGVWVSVGLFGALSFLSGGRGSAHAGAGAHERTAALG